MENLRHAAKAKPSCRAAKPAGKFAQSADDYLRSSQANKKALRDAIAAAARGELVEFDPRKK